MVLCRFGEQQYEPYHIAACISGEPPHLPRKVRRAPVRQRAGRQPEQAIHIHAQPCRKGALGQAMAGLVRIEDIANPLWPG